MSKALLSMNKQLPYHFFIRVSAIVLLFCAVLTFNTLYFKCLESGIGIYGGLFHVNTITQVMEIFIYLIGSIILIAWPIKYTSNYIKNPAGNLTSRASHTLGFDYSGFLKAREEVVVSGGYSVDYPPFNNPETKYDNDDIWKLYNDILPNNDITMDYYTIDYSILILFTTKTN